MVVGNLVRGGSDCRGVAMMYGGDVIVMEYDAEDTDTRVRTRSKVLGVGCVVVAMMLALVWGNHGGHGLVRACGDGGGGIDMMMVLVNATVVRSVAELLVGEKQRASWWWLLFLVVMEGCGVGCSLQVHM
ncbi:uncharacterized protein M6B38_150090 [Iris pallida]|uniref:Uncharacterized protein n=1 Tax=Iris pallida TaxID=29817 RepID=A0AAX6F734_IRIPA|nr:uncharacterized protein M6B38_150090 [Iris pallida]